MGRSPGLAGAHERGLSSSTTTTRWRWSVDEPARSGSRFWTTSRSGRPDGWAAPGPALADARMPGAHWFPGASL